MFRSLARSINPAMAVAFLALFLCFTAPAMAKWFAPKNSVGTKAIKRSAVTSAKVKNNTLTGDDIRESTLGKVPRAEIADSLGGLTPSQLTTNDKFVTANVLLQVGEERQIMSFGPFGVVARCVANNPGVVPWSRVTTSGSNAYAYVTPGNSEDVSFSAPEVKNSQLGPATQVPDKAAAGSFDLHDPASGLVAQGSVQAYLNFGGPNCRFVGYATVTRP